MASVAESEGLRALQGAGLTAPGMSWPDRKSSWRDLARAKRLPSERWRVA